MEYKGTPPDEPTVYFVAYFKIHLWKKTVLTESNTGEKT